MWSEVEMKRTEEKDRLVQRALENARNRPPRPMSTPESVAAGDAAMAEAHAQAAEDLVCRIESKELLSADELRSALGISQAEINDTVEDNRLFTIDGPDGQPYYPAFYADGDMDRVAFGLVAQALCDLPSGANYHFFISKRTNLGETPLEALRRGRVAEVLQAASGFSTT